MVNQLWHWYTVHTQLIQTVCMGRWRGLWQICLGLQFNQQQEDKTKKKKILSDMFLQSQTYVGFLRPYNSLRRPENICTFPVLFCAVWFEVDIKLLLSSPFSLAWLSIMLPVSQWNISHLQRHVVVYVSFLKCCFNPAVNSTEYRG